MTLTISLIVWITVITQQKLHCLRTKEGQYDATFFRRNKNIPCPQTIKNLKSNLYLYLRSWNCLKGIQSKLCNKCIWRNIPLVSSSPSPLIPRYFILHALYFLQRSFSKIHLFLDFFSLICGSSFFFFPIKQCPSPPASFSVNLLSLWLSRWHSGKRIHLP